ncbi:MAG TPA: hypothetical protein EYQ75_11035 [Planctomycetaceae bacterium]|nr:hypothetical protein [Planctomycetaceae bacterium]
MSEVLVVLLILFVVLAILTALGHGVWLLVAVCIRTVFGSAGQEAAVRRTCPSCGTANAIVDDRCPLCGYDTRLHNSIRADLQAAARQANRMVENQSMTEVERDNFHHLLRSEYQRIVNEPLPRLLRDHGTEERPKKQRVSPTETGPEKTDQALPPLRSVSESMSERVDQESGMADVVWAEVIQTPAGPLTPPAAVHPLDLSNSDDSLEQPTATVPALTRIRRSFGEILQRFMEEKNIRWGELLSGLLIVGCAIGLVISLQDTLRETIPYFPAMLFMFGTVAIHGSGLYTLRKWNLHTTSRGVLIIATLLIPLNFVASIIISGTGESRLATTDPIYWAAVLIGLAVFGAMTYFSSRAMADSRWWRLWLVVMGPSAGQLVINRSFLMGEQPETGTLWLMAALPLLSVTAGIWSHLHQEKSLTANDSSREQTFLLLGIAGFSFVIAVGLLVARTADHGQTLAGLAPALSIVGATVMACGMVIHQQYSGSKTFTGTRTAGTAIALIGSVIQLGLFLIAWPNPMLLIAVAVVNVVACTVLAVVCRASVLHAATAVATSIGLLLALHVWVFGSFLDPVSSRQLAEALILGRSGAALAVIGALFVSAGIATRGRFQLSTPYITAGCAVGVLGVATTSISGFAHSLRPAVWAADAPLATWVFLSYGLLALIAASLTRLRWVTTTAVGLLFVGVVHAFGYNPSLQPLIGQIGPAAVHPLVLGVIVYGLVVMAIAAFGHAAVGRNENSEENGTWFGGLTQPLCWAATLTAAMAIPFVVMLHDQLFTEHALYAVMLAITWLGVAWLLREPGVFVAAQVAVTFSLACLVIGHAAENEWVLNPLFDVRHLLAQLTAVAGIGAVFSGTRIGLRRWAASHAQRVLGEFPGAEQCMVLIATVCLFGVGLVGCWNGIVTELGLFAVGETISNTLPATWYGGQAWLVLGVITMACVIASLERVSVVTMGIGLVAAGSVSLLVAGPFSESNSVASALRWSFALYAALATSAYCMRNRFSFAAVIPDHRREKFARTVIVAGGSLPVWGLTFASAAQAITGHPPGGPLAESLFASLDPTLSFGIPLTVMVGCYVAFAVREREPRFMLAGSVALQVLILLAMSLQHIGQPFDTVFIARTTAAVACGLGIFSFAWWGLSRWLIADTDSRDANRTLMKGHWVVAVSVVFGLVVMGTAQIVVFPHSTIAWQTEIGGWSTFVAWLFAGIVATGIFRGDLLERRRFGWLWLATLVAFLAVVRARWDNGGDWLAYHTLSIGFLCYAVVAVAIGRWQGQKQGWTDAVVASASATLGVVLLALRGAISDPMHPALTAALTGGAIVVVVMLAEAARRHVFTYASLALAVLLAVSATATWWPQASWLDTFACIILAVAVLAILWMAMELFQQTRGRHGLVDDGLPAHRAAVVGLLAGFLGVFGAGFLINLVGQHGPAKLSIAIDSPASWIACLAVGLLSIGLIWDRNARFSLATTYTWSISLILVACTALARLAEWDVQAIMVVTGLVVAGLVCGTGHTFRRSRQIEAWARGVAVPPLRNGERSVKWLPAANLLIGTAIVAFEMNVVLAFDARWMRILAAFVPVVVAVGIGCSARGRTPVQIVCLIFVSLGAVAVSWADMLPDWHQAALLARVVRMVVATAAMSFAFATLAAKRLPTEHAWHSATRTAAAVNAAAATFALLIALSLEFLMFVPGQGVLLATPLMLVVSIMLVALIVALLTISLLPGTDPLKLSETWRESYVYGAQVVGGLLFAHIYLCRPDWFSDVLRPYWPFIVMSIAFAGVFVAELFERKGLHILSGPFRMTGSMLPLVPVIGFWIDIPQTGHVDYSMLLFVVGLLYVVVAAFQRTSWSIAAAVLAGNAALWALLSEQGTSVLLHPQMWIIPPALCVLAAAQLNRTQLSASQLTGSRYASMVLIYLSSTVEMFVTGVGDSILAPMLLAGLAVIGAMMGIVMQIRAFLYLGTSFLFLSIVTMVWHASTHINHSWPWWAFGIGLGLAILAMFGVFEKRRQDILQVIGTMKEWDA